MIATLPLQGQDVVPAVKQGSSLQVAESASEILGGVPISKFKELVQVPVDVTVNCVAVSDTDTDLPTSNSDLVAVDGVTLPTFAVRLKLGPKSAPSDEFNVTNKFILF